MTFNKHDELGSWGSELARLWTNYYPPCRPSSSEITIYSDWLRKIQKKNSNQKIKLLILGSTSEFRDWGHEENLDVTIIDFSKGYNQTIAEQMKYKNVEEQLVLCSWQDMGFSNEFDIIVGDLVIGNLCKEEVPSFLDKINKALRRKGFFMTKSFFRNEKYKIKQLPEIFSEYKSKYSSYNAFSLLIYDIALSCMNTQTDILDFSSMYERILILFNEGKIDRKMLAIFSNLGWQNNMKFEFYLPTTTYWEKLSRQSLNIKAKVYGSDIYSKNFPVYILAPKGEK